MICLLREESYYCLYWYMWHYSQEKIAYVASSLGYVAKLSKKRYFNSFGVYNFLSSRYQHLINIKVAFPQQSVRYGEKVNN